MSTALQDIQAKIKQDLAGLKDSVPPPSGRTISTKGKVFTFPSGKTSQGPIEAIILDHRNLNKYYSAAYNPNNLVPPDCFALSKQAVNFVPHPASLKKQAEACKDCPWDEWGSAPNGSKGKACRNTVRLAIVEPDATADNEPYILSVSPTGIKSWSALINGLEVKGVHPIQIVTQIAFDPNQAYPTLVFKPLRPAGEEDRIATFWSIREKAQALLDALPTTRD